MIIFDADDPLVVNGTYDQEGYKPGERARIAKSRARQPQQEDQMKKPKNTARPLGAKAKPKGKARATPVPPKTGRSPVATTTRTAPDRVRGRRPKVDQAPNRPPADARETPIALACEPIVITDDLAPAQLRELAEKLDDVTRATAIYTDKNDAAKTAKKTVESKTELLLETLRAFVHPSPLPLFDERNESRAVTRMIEGADLIFPGVHAEDVERPPFDAVEADEPATV